MKPRRAERVRAFLGAQILFNHRNSTLDCQVRNISVSGAKLIVSPTVSVPDEFELVVPQKGRSFRCRLRWRIDDSAGVEFLDAAPSVERQSISLKDRVLELETENEALHRQVRELSERLAAAESGRVSA